MNVTVALILFAVGSALDIRSSLGLPERNPLFRDRLGRFAARRNVVATAGFMIANVLLSISHPDATAAALGIGAALRGAVAMQNVRVRHRLRMWTRTKRGGV